MNRHLVDLLGCSLLGIIGFIGICLFLEVDTNSLLISFLPIDIYYVLIASILYTLLHIAFAFYMNNGGISNRPLWFFVFQPSAEEMLFRYNSFVILNAGYQDLTSILTVFLVQLVYFVATHRKSYLFLTFVGTLHFLVGYFFGMIPLLLGHTAYNITLYMLSEPYEEE